MNKADYIIKSNAIFTGLDSKPFEGGVAVVGSRIAAVGNDRELMEWIGPDTDVIGYGDKLIMPGFIDAHMHFFTGAFVNSDYMLTEAFDAHSEAECVDMVERFAKKHPELPRITGMGWFPAWWEKGSALPDRRSLDAVVPDRPVYMLSADGHTFWLNSKALEECGIGKDSTVTFGRIGKDEDGELTGLLFEIEAEAAANEYAFLLPEKLMKEIQQDFYKEIARHGITATTNMSVNPVVEGSFKEFEIAAELEKEGKLTVRLHLYPSLGLDADYRTVRELKERFCSDKLRISGLKQFVDGVTSTYTAYMIEPYADRPDTLGFSNYPAELYAKCVAAANKEGFPVRLHAIGDAAVRLALDAFEGSRRLNGSSTLKNTIEHIESIHPDDIRRFPELNVVASVQPIHLNMDANEKVERLGEERCRYEWPFRSMLETGAMLAFGTDFPVAGIDPFANIYAAVTRLDNEGVQAGINPQEKIALADALKAYTYGSACAINREDELGTLEAGKLADIVVLDRNIFDVPCEDIKKTAVELTMMDGSIIYRK